MDSVENMARWGLVVVVVAVCGLALYVNNHRDGYESHGTYTYQNH